MKKSNSQSTSSGVKAHVDASADREFEPLPSQWANASFSDIVRNSQKVESPFGKRSPERHTGMNTALHKQPIENGEKSGTRAPTKRKIMMVRGRNENGGAMAVENVRRIELFISRLI